MFGSFEKVKCKYLRKSQVWPGGGGRDPEEILRFAQNDNEGRVRMTTGGGNDDKRPCHKGPVILGIMAKKCWGK